MGKVSHLDLKELVKGLQATRLLYWEDTYIKEFDASLLRVEPDGQKYVYLILDRTAFHPKSGGQPADLGVISGSGWQAKVRKVIMVGGVIVHWVQILSGKVEGNAVKGIIDWDWRYLLMRRHTAGHLFDHCLTVVTGTPVRTMGSWLGEGCSVSYAGKPPSKEALERAEKMELELIRKGLLVRVEVIPQSELMRVAPTAPNIQRLPTMADRIRVVTIEGCKPIPCGGTHVHNTREIGQFKILGVREKEEDYDLIYDVK